MVMNPRGKHSHIYGIQSAGGGFNGFPASGNMKSGYATDQPTGSFELKQVRVMPKLSNGRRWVHPNDEMPLHKEDISKKINAFSKNFFLYGFPQSNPSLPALNGRPNSVTTAGIPNPKSVPFYEDLAEVQGNLPKDHVLHHKEVDVKTARELFTPPEEKIIKEYQLKVAELRNNKIAEALIRKGYSEDEVLEYFHTLRQKDIEKAVKNAEEEGTTPAGVLQQLYNDNLRTGLNATGSVPLGATQSVSVHQLAVNELKGLPGIQRRAELRGVPAGAESPNPAQPSSMIAAAISRRSSIASDPGIAAPPKVKFRLKPQFRRTLTPLEESQYEGIFEK